MYTLKAMAEKTQKKSKGNKKPNSKNNKTQKIKLPNNMVIEVRKPNMFSNVFFYLFLAFAIYLVFGTIGESALSQEEIPIGQVVRLINEDKVQDITVTGDKIEVLQRSGTKVYAKKEGSISFDQILSNNQVDRSKITGKL
jgi:hypothetical protein